MVTDKQRLTSRAFQLKTNVLDRCEDTIYTYNTPGEASLGVSFIQIIQKNIWNISKRQ